MSIRFLTSGLISTLQDLGRFQFRRFGINPNGAMDRDALRLLNALLRNEEDAAAIEMHFPAPKILFENDALIAIAGADFGAQIGQRPLANWQTHFVEKNEVLSFAKRISGNRAYLIVHGGFEVENWLGSANSRKTTY
jgi:antagonist of KipI